MNLFGYAMLVISYIPQYIHLYKVKESCQINLLWPCSTAIALILMEPLALTGGLIEYSIGNTSGLIVCLCLIAQVVYYRKRKKASK